jgi:two-component system CAI-1 autoinducer sensor kinase/phosphatase CqsS
LIADAVQAQVRPHSDDANSRRLAKLATSLHALARNMNHQIDTQIANARLQQLPQPSELVAAGEVVTRVVAGFPYRTSRERECVQTVIHQDFRFISSHALFSQVLDNLIKNALHSLAAANSQTRPGDLRIEVGVVHGKGRITLTDNGTGIAPQLLPRIFEPFFSTDSGTGHGLGLAFCRRVVQSARGSIRVKSQPDVGAVFSIELPIAA